MPGGDSNAGMELCLCYHQKAKQVAFAECPLEFVEVVQDIMTLPMKDVMQLIKEEDGEHEQGQPPLCRWVQARVPRLGRTLSKVTRAVLGLPPPGAPKVEAAMPSPALARCDWLNKARPVLLFTKSTPKCPACVLHGRADSPCTPVGVDFIPKIPGQDDLDRGRLMYRCSDTNCNTYSNRPRIRCSKCGVGAMVLNCCLMASDGKVHVPPRAYAGRHAIASEEVFLDSSAPLVMAGDSANLVQISIPAFSARPAVKVGHTVDSKGTMFRCIGNCGVVATAPNGKCTCGHPQVLVCTLCRVTSGPQGVVVKWEPLRTQAEGEGEGERGADDEYENDVDDTDQGSEERAMSRDNVAVCAPRGAGRRGWCLITDRLEVITDFPMTATMELVKKKGFNSEEMETIRVPVKRREVLELMKAGGVPGSESVLTELLAFYLRGRGIRNAAS